MRRERTIGTLLLVNALANGPWSVALQLCIALMVKQHDPRLFDFEGLAALGLIIGVSGAGDVAGNLIAGSVRFRRPLSTMFLGYVAMGGGFALIAVAAWLLPNPWMLPAMMLAGLLAGFGGPFYFIPMITRLQTAYPRPRDRPRLPAAPRGDGGLDAGLQPRGHAAVRPAGPDPHRVPVRPPDPGAGHRRALLFPAGRKPAAKNACLNCRILLRGTVCIDSVR